jgi:hypothetical protein
MPASYKWSIFKALKSLCSGLTDPDVCSEHELKRRADYLGIPIAQLRWVSSRRPDPIGLLERRMEAISLNPNEVAHIEPLMIRELRQRCIKCEKREKCALDLADKRIDPDGQSWRVYCPNAATLAMLSALQAARADDPASADL